MGFQPHVLDKINDILNRYDFDFIINSVHIIEHKDLIPEPSLKAGHSSRLMKDIWRKSFAQ